MAQSDFRKYLGELKAATSDDVAPGIKGNLARLARLAAHCQGPVERKEVARVLKAKGIELGVDVSRVAVEIGPAK
jgi:rhodanese-related sulfurtransferase